ncbi:MAG: delta-60 repeat domain-containing protein, partial [Planctomycetota bacterium]
MKIVCWSLIIVCFGAVQFSFGQPGTLDRTFGKEGVVDFDVEGVERLNIRKIAFDQNGKLVVAGEARVEGNLDTDLFFARFNADGTIDETFGKDGQGFVSFALPAESEDFVFGLGLQSTGKIVFAANSKIGDNCTVVVGRLRMDGTPDESFHANSDRAYVELFSYQPIFEVYDWSGILSIDESDEIFVGHTAFWEHRYLKLRPDGELDFNFGSNGQLEFQNPDVYGLEYPMAMSRLSDHSMLFCVGADFFDPKTNSSTGESFLFKLNGSGDFVSFGTNKNQFPGFGFVDQSNFVFDVVATDEKIFVAGFLGVLFPGTISGFMAGMDLNGLSDPEFGNGGVIALDEESSIVRKLLFDSKGNLYGVGTRRLQGVWASAVFAIKVLPTGQLDLDFGDQGLADPIEIFSGNGDRDFVMAPDDKIYIVSTSGDATLSMVRVSVGPVLGDVNRDNVVNLFDINPF